MAIRPRQGEGLELIEATECSKCGCKDRITRGGQNRCRHCGKPWVRRIARAGEAQAASEVEEPPGVTYYHLVKCPECGSDKTKITSTRRPIRHHKCKSCGGCFKSTER